MQDQTPSIAPAAQAPDAPLHRALLARCLVLAGLVLAAAVVAPAASAAGPVTNTRASAASLHPSRAFWLDLAGKPAATAANGARPSIQPTKFRAFVLDRVSLASYVAAAPLEFSDAARQTPLIVSLPGPDGVFQRFSIVNSPVMEPGLAALHPEITTFAGRGIDDPTAHIRLDVSQLGFHASVRSSAGRWGIDPYYHLDPSLHVSYYAKDLPNPRGPLTEPALLEPQVALAQGRYHAADTVQVSAAGFAPRSPVTITVRNLAADAAPRQVLYSIATRDGTVSSALTADPYKNLGSYEVVVSDGKLSASSVYQVVGNKVALNAATGSQLRTYRLALVTDNNYATYFGGSANVTAAKVALINRVTQVYETETSIRLVLIAKNDLLNLDTAAQITGANGPCGSSACFTAAQVASCGSSTLSRNRIVVGLLVGASNFDIGHIALGVNGGGIASLGVVGGSSKAQGCTGIPTPVGDFYAVDYVAHEMGHQFAGNHTFNGTVLNCSTSNRNAGTSVEPGSGSSVMAYAGICGTDDLQPHSDAYWSQRSFDEITTYTSSAETNLNEVQQAALTNFGGTQQFQLTFNEKFSVPIVNGVNFTTAGIKAAIEGIAYWPAGGTVTISALTTTGFTITYGGTLAGVNVPQLQLFNCTDGTTSCSGYIGEVTKGGISTKGGTASATTNTAPVVTAPASFTIPVQTPFALTGSAVDAEGDPITYMWEQNDRGATGTANGTGLVTQPKLNGPLFRQFGTAAVVSSTDTLLYNSPGENLVTGNPTRVFPDMAQILANNTNAETGVCPLAVPATPTATEIDCFSEFLPTPTYVGTASVNASPLSLNFRLTARDGRGGVGSANTQLLLAPGAGPFLVTSPNTAVVLSAGSAQTVTWAVANTDVAPVSTANVKITLSVDGGLTFPYVLSASTPNTGSAVVTLPNVATASARVKVEAVGNVFFDVSNANFKIQ